MRMTHDLPRLVAAGYFDTGARTDSMPGHAQMTRIARQLNRDAADVRAFRIAASPEAWAIMLAPGASDARPYVERPVLPA